MYHSQIDLEKIAKAISYSMQAVKDVAQCETALTKLEAAHADFNQAMSFCLSSIQDQHFSSR